MQRLTAAKDLEWDEIEANLVNVDESQAALLAIETNLVRKDLKEIDEGKAIKEIMDRLGLNQQQIADKLGKSQRWVSNRLALGLDLVNPVMEMLSNNYLSPSQAVFIARLNEDKQTKFANLLIERQQELGRKLNGNEIRDELKKFQNNTILTVGYEGQDITRFIKLLQKKKVEMVLDVRESTKSLQKPEFEGKFLRERLEEHKIRYEHRKDLGAPYEIREAYINGGMSQDCFNNWYKWNVTQREGDKLPDLIEHLKTSGRTAILCYEKDVNTCHRNILVDLIMEKNAFEVRRDI
jgi:ParB family chromosome partitioning protein